jgi:hypothetical protein
VDEAFFKDASIQYVKNKLYEYNKNNVAVLDYVLLKDPGCQYSTSALFRIIRPRYQIAYKDKYGKIYYSENTYDTFKQATSVLGKMIFNKELPETRKYYVETISYLDEEI